MQSVRRYSSLGNILILVSILFVAYFEWFLFRKCFLRNVATAYPNGWDQLGVYTRIYQLYFDWEKFGLGLFTEKNAWIFDKASMKGFISQLFGLLLVSTFGVSRLVAASVNFWWLIVAELTLLIALTKRFGIAAALIGIGLFLTSLMHYIPVGGIYDLRLDYVGMTVFGITTVCIWKFLERGGWSSFCLASFCLFLSVFNRSILIFYLVGGLVTLFAASLILRIVLPHIITIRDLFKRSAAVMCSSFVTMGIFLTIYWTSFYKYYLERAISGENAQWAVKYGVHNRFEIVFFNLQSSLHLFGIMLLTFAAVVLLAAFFKILGRTRKRLIVTNGTLLLTLLTSCISFATLFCICSWMPSPNSIGVLTLPLAATMATIIASFCDTHSRKFVALSVLTVACGLGFFSFKMLHPASNLAPPREQADVINEVNRKLIGHIRIGRDRTRIAYPLQTEGLHAQSLYLQWYESEKKPLPENLEASFMPVYRAIKWTDFKKICSRQRLCYLAVIQEC